ncbi:MAG: carboxypeptidase-like regulatory domain-containing protein [Terracidiphilus sp.]
MMKLNSLWRSIPLAIAVLLALALPVDLRAQASSTASITGSVTDPTGAVIPGATIELSNPGTGQTYKTVANQVGSYTLTNVAPGPGYKETVSHDGFETTVLSGLYMNVGSTRTQNVKLAVGAVTATIAVSAENQTVTLDTTDATVGNNFQVQYMQDLPVMVRDTPLELLTQQPGMTNDGSSTGARTDQSRVTLDGLDVNDEAYGSFGAVVAGAPVDSVQEFKGTTAGMLSSNGAGGGGQFDMVTKSGTNHFHGDLNEYHRDTDLEANEWFNNFDGVARAPLVRNQYGGSIGGPIWKDKAFFFFDYNGRHDSLSTIATRTVPMTPFLKNDSISYYTNITSGAKDSINAAQVKGFDPQGVGFDQGMITTLAARYPAPNDFTGDAGDLVNTAGYRFNAPEPYIEKNYVGRLDLDPFPNHHLFGRVTYNNINSVAGAPQFSGDPETYPYLDTSHAWVVGWDWTMGTTKTNTVIWGSTIAKVSTQDTYNPLGANQYEFDGDPTGGYFLSGPYAGAGGSARYFPIPVVRDDFHWEKGRHSLTFGGDFKYPSPHYATYGDYNGPIVGLGGFVTGLPTNGTSEFNFDPSNLDNSQTSLTVYQSALVLALGRFEDTNDTWNYNSSGSAVPQGTGLQTTFRYYETEFYFGDTWKMTPSLTFTYGLRYENFTVPYEIHGIESDQNLSFWDFMNARIAQSKAGVSGPASVPGYGSSDIVPYVKYNLAGKANNAPGYYQPDNKDFAPRVAFAWTPPGMNRKLVVNGGGGIVYDESVVNAFLQEEASYSYLFESSGTKDYGVPATSAHSAAYNSLLENTRFTSYGNPPPGPGIPKITKPFIPFVGPGSPECPTPGPCGLANGGAFNISVDHNLPTPYNIMYNLGFQYELKGGYIAKLGYVGRLGRHLLAQTDAEQLIDFPDKVSGQELSTAMANLTTWLRANPNAPLTSVPAQPFFEHVLYPNGTGISNTAFIAESMAPYPARGDVADSVDLMSGYGLLPDNVGMAAQLSENTFFTDLGFSSYNGVLATLHKNTGYGLQFDLNYTFSHSIDNVSLVANSYAYEGYGYICDVLRPRLCRGNSDFDVTQYVNGNALYTLPFGRGKQFAANIPLWADEFIGGWELSGLPIYHTGQPYMANSIAFLMSYSNEDPAILSGSLSGLTKSHVTVGSDGVVSTFKNPVTAFSQWRGPVGFEMGSRNNLRGPGFFDTDLGLGKSFPFPIYHEGMTLKFRCDAFNAFNHPNFQHPSFQYNMDLTSPPNEFGTIPGTVTPTGSDLSARVLQGSLRLEF